MQVSSLRKILWPGKNKEFCDWWLERGEKVESARTTDWPSPEKGDVSSLGFNVFAEWLTTGGEAQWEFEYKILRFKRKIQTKERSFMNKKT